MIDRSTIQEAPDGLRCVVGRAPRLRVQFCEFLSRSNEARRDCGEVFLSLPRRWCWESTVSLGLVGVDESGPAVVVEPVLAGLLQAVLADLSDGFSASVVFVVGGDVADGLVESDVIIVAADSVQLGF